MLPPSAIACSCSIRSSSVPSARSRSLRGRRGSP
jgi:hypothetical protein